MSYSSVAFLCLIIFFIINYNLITKSRDDLYEKIPAIKNYRTFLIAVLVFFIVDSLWGLIEIADIKVFLFIDTSVFFCMMALTVFLWSRCILAYLNEKTKMMMFVNITGWFFFIAQCIVVIINIFLPIMFYIDDKGDYHTGPFRYVSMIVQIVMYLLCTVYMFYTTIKSKKGKLKVSHMTIGLFGLVMTVFISIQALYPMLPLYSIGYIIGTCLLYTFVLEGLKKEQVILMKEHLALESRQRIEIGEARRVAYTDSLTSVKNKHAFVEAESEIDQKIADHEQREFGIIMFDLNGLKYVNDNFGHDNGDKYLKEASSMICNMFKHSAVFRIGGDEFVAILEGQDYENREELLTKFDQEVEKNVRELKEGTNTTPVIIATGYTSFDPETDNAFNSLFVRADQNMYDRKRDLKAMGSI